MSMQEKSFRNFQALANFLSKLANDEQTEWVFRGHNDNRHKLKTSYERYTSIAPEEWDSTPDRLLGFFKDGLIRLGTQFHSSMDRHALMEHARHHGVPTPILDFSRSPFIALFFAFNRIGSRLPTDKGYSAVYCLNVNMLAKHWAREQSSDLGSPEFAEQYRKFKYPDYKPFETGYPPNTFLFLPAPGEFSVRMQRQLGVFLYCTLEYSHRKVSDLEEFLGGLDDSIETSVLQGTQQPTLLKLKIPHSMARDAYKYLELVNITGEALFGNPEGIADDIWNAYHYHRRACLRNENKF